MTRNLNVAKHNIPKRIKLSGMGTARRVRYVTRVNVLGT